MIDRCECIVLKHKNRCEKFATKQCTTCGEKMCAHCAREHHQHYEFVQLGGKHAGPLPF